MNWIKQRARVLIPYLGLVFVVAFFGIASKGAIFKGTNLATIINQAYTTVMLATGLCLFYAQGGIDFSPGGVLALSVLCAVMVVNATGIAILALPVCIGVGLLCYFLTGFITVKLNLNPFIGTVSMMFLTRGIVNSVLQVRKTTPISLGAANVSSQVKCTLFRQQMHTFSRPVFSL